MNTSVKIFLVIICTVFLVRFGIITAVEAHYRHSKPADGTVADAERAILKQSGVYPIQVQTAKCRVSEYVSVPDRNTLFDCGVTFAPGAEQLGAHWCVLDAQGATGMFPVPAACAAGPNVVRR